MAATYAFDVYAAADPVGTLLARLTVGDSLISGWYRHVARGAGEGQIQIHGDSAAATAAILAPRNHVVFVRTDTDPEQAIGSFFLEVGEFRAVSRGEAGGRVLTYGGPSAIVLLERGRLLEDVYAPAPPASTVRGGTDNPGEWFWYAQAYGGILSRAVEEGQNQPGTPLTDVVITFSRTEDTDGNPWDEVNSWRVPIGTSVYEVMATFMTYGLIVQMGPDLHLGAWDQMSDFSTDRTSATFAADKARFEAGVNIATEITSRIDPLLARSHVLVETNNGAYAEVDTGGTGVGFWSHLRLNETDDVAVAARAGQFYLEQRDRMTRAYTVRHIIGDVDAEGLYAPGPEGSYWVGDLVTLHTGILEHDADELSIEVAGITYAHDEAGNWYAETELGAQYMGPDSRPEPGNTATEIRVPNGLTPCVATVPGGDVEYESHRLYLTGDDWSTFTDDAGWEVSFADSLELGPSPGSFASIDGAQTADETDSAANRDRHVLQLVYPLSAGTLLTALQNGGATIRGQFLTRARYGTGISEGAQDAIAQESVRVISSGGTVRGTALALHALGSSSGSVKFLSPDPPPPYYRNSRFPPAAASAVLSAVPSAVAGDRLVIELGCRHFAPTTGGSGVAIYKKGTAGTGDLPENESSSSNLNSWLEITNEIVGSETPGYAGDGHSDLHGTPGTVAGCGHRHHVIRDADPTADDDVDAGYPTGTFWYTVDGDEITGAFLSLDDSSGAAVWATVAGSGSGGAGNAWSMSKTSSQTITSNADTTITFDRTDVDGGGSVVDLANDRFVAPATGLYLIITHWLWESTVPANGARVYATINGSAQVQNRPQAATNGGNGSVDGAHVFSLASGDFVGMGIHPGAAVTPTARGNASRNLSSSLSMVRIT
jgi:hypothetical protein